MATIGIVVGTAIANSGVTLRARVRGAAGVLLTQASIQSITVTVTDLVTGSVVATLTPAVSSVWFDALQTDPDWTKDSAAAPGPDGSYGFNFSFTVPSGNSTGGSSLNAAGQTVMNRMQADVAIVPLTGQPFRQVFQWTPIRVYG